MRLLDFTSGGTMMTLPDDELRQQRDDALVESLRLSLISGVGPLTRRALLARFGSPEAVFRAAPDELRSVGPKLMRSIVAAGDEIDPESEIAICRASNVAILTEADEAYPRMLREIHDPPGVLFVRGELLPQDTLAVAIVGTRHATQYGLRQAELLAGSLARAGLTIVSGLARGIDAAAHRGAIQAGGRTIAVLASGVLNIYPPEHEELARQVIAHGALVSESPPRFAPLSGAFPQRNRLISGLALGAIIVEAAERSGALITARLAAEQDREVFAVPGHVDSRTARGCHRLIRDGAKLVESADDVLEELGPLVQATPRADGQIVHHPAELLLNEPEKAVLAAIDGEATSIDQIVVDTGMAVARVLSTLSVLEMRRLIRRLSGSTVVRV
jgi:DNA processing protein